MSERMNTQSFNERLAAALDIMCSSQHHLAHFARLGKLPPKDVLQTADADWTECHGALEVVRAALASGKECAK